MNSNITRLTYAAVLVLIVTIAGAPDGLAKSMSKTSHHRTATHHPIARSLHHGHKSHGDVSQSRANGLSSTGKATIYSDKFNGRKTATGERFRQDQLTAASPHLPLGSKVKVTNKATGKSAVVKINDRQARGGNRVVDLSKAAASKIGIKGKGDVQTTVVGK